MSLMPFLMDFTDGGFADFDFESGYEEDFGFGVYPHDIHQRYHRAPRLQIYSARRLPYNLGKKLTAVAAAASVSAAAATTTSALSSSSSSPSTLTSSTIKSSNLDESDKKSSYSSIGKDGFQVCMNVQQFKPNELTVKTVENNVIIEGKHDEREDNHGYITRHFTRKYILPKGYDSKEIISTLSSDGILTIKSPPPIQIIENPERIIQIQHTGPAHLNVKQNQNQNQNSNSVTTTTTTTSSSSSSSSPTPPPPTTATTISNSSNSNSNSTNQISQPNPIITAAAAAVAAAATTVPPIVQKEKCENVIKEKCENGEKCENEKNEKNNEIMED